MEALATDASPLSMICCSRDRMCLLFCWISRSKFSICYKDVCQYYEQLYNVYKNRLQNPATGNVILHVMHVNSKQLILMLYVCLLLPSFTCFPICPAINFFPEVTYTVPIITATSSNGPRLILKKR